MKAKKCDDICKMTIMYVDDDADVSAMVLHMLSKNYPTQNVVHAENGIDALSKIRECDPDILLVDIYMPLLDGITFIEKYVSERLAIIVSACNDKKLMQRCLTVGARYYVTKPIDFDFLFYSMDTLMVEIFYKRFARAKANF